jgi:glucose-1-phosphate adenylyltransferase
VHRSLISHGCVVYGTVERSVLSPGVRVEVGAVVRDSIVMFDSVVGPGAVLERAILDKEVTVGPNAVIGDGNDSTPNRTDPRLDTGITLIGKRATIPRGVRIGRNVLIDESARPADFPRRIVASGTTISPRGRTRPRVVEQVASALGAGIRR